MNECCSAHFIVALIGLHCPHFFNWEQTSNGRRVTHLHIPTWWVERVRLWLLTFTCLIVLWFLSQVPHLASNTPRSVCLVPCKVQADRLLTRTWSRACSQDVCLVSLLKSCILCLLLVPGSMRAPAANEPSNQEGWVSSVKALGSWPDACFCGNHSSMQHLGPAALAACHHRCKAHGLELPWCGMARAQGPVPSASAGHSMCIADVLQACYLCTHNQPDRLSP